jgi:hypothetical protein
MVIGGHVWLRHGSCRVCLVWSGGIFFDGIFVLRCPCVFFRDQTSAQTGASPCCQAVSDGELHAAIESQASNNLLHGFILDCVAFDGSKAFHGKHVHDCRQVHAGVHRAGFFGFEHVCPCRESGGVIVPFVLGGCFLFLHVVGRIDAAAY